MLAPTANSAVHAAEKNRPQEKNTLPFPFRECRRQPSQRQLALRCHPEEVRAFAKRRPADEGSMYSAPCFYYVYLMTNRSKTLYTGVTGNLEKRAFEHKQGVKGKFAARYKIDRLVYFERFGDIHAAIAREKQIKGLTRVKKMALIVSVN